MKLVLVGATGLVGREVLKQALDDPRISLVVAPTRRALAGFPGGIAGSFDDKGGERGIRPFETRPSDGSLRELA